MVDGFGILEFEHRMPNATHKLTQNYLYKLIQIMVVALLVLLLADRAGHWYRHNDPYNRFLIQKDFLMLKQQYHLSSDYQPTFSIFYRLSEHKYNQIKAHYAKLAGNNDFYTSVELGFNTVSCKQLCRQIISKSSGRQLAQYDNNQIARWYYELGISDYGDDNIESAINFLEYARRLAPEWSFFHIELAAIYYEQGHITKSVHVLNQCKLFSQSEIFCWTPLDNVIMGDLNIPVGSLMDKVRDAIHYPEESIR
jgi:hypothetical protein